MCIRDRHLREKYHSLNKGLIYNVLNPEYVTAIIQYIITGAPLVEFIVTEIKDKQEELKPWEMLSGFFDIDVYKRQEDRWNTDTERRDLTVWLFDEESFVPMAMIKEGRSYSILTDQLGTPTEAYDAEGNEVWSRVLDMDGNVIEETGNKGMVPFLFQGQYYDRETGLAYNRFRYYSPQMGMYVSQDPIGLAGGMRLYGYIQNTNYGMDVLGLKGCYLKEAEEGQSYKFVLQISKSEYPETTRHIQNAIKKGHPDVCLLYTSRCV